jgi:hypothetical protein
LPQGEESALEQALTGGRMRIANVTFEGCNEIDSFVAAR